MDRASEGSGSYPGPREHRMQYRPQPIDKARAHADRMEARPPNALSTSRKRHRSRSNARSHSVLPGVEGQFDDAEDQHEVHTGGSPPKRARTGASPRDGRGGSAEARSHGRKSPPPRSSRFKEASMNDRVSSKPPSVFIKGEEAMEAYKEDNEHGITVRLPQRKYPRSGSATGSNGRAASEVSEGSHLPRDSGIFRFGKTVASIFKSNFWDGMFGHQKPQDGTDSQRKAVLDDRRARAEKTYAELKAQGRIQTSNLASQHYQDDSFAVGYHETSEGPSVSFHRDSGVDVDEYRSSNENWREDRHESDDIKVRSSGRIKGFKEFERGLERSQARFNRMPPLHIRKTSLPNLKKVQSDAVPGTPNRGITVGIPPLPGSSSKVPASARPLVRKQQSKKDLQKQQKLQKRVSDLETKLDVARRELSLLGVVQDDSNADSKSTGQADDKSFKRTPLPSLPSERLLQAEKAENGNGRHHKETQDITYTSPKSLIVKLPLVLPMHREQKRNTDDSTSEQIVFSQPNNKPTVRKTRKRRSSGADKDDAYKPTEDVDQETKIAMAGAPPRRNPARKSQRLTVADSPGSVEKKQPVASGHIDKNTTTPTIKPQGSIVYNSAKTIANPTSLQHPNHPPPKFLAPPRASSKTALKTARSLSRLSQRRSTSPPPRISPSRAARINQGSRESSAGHGNQKYGASSTDPFDDGIPPVPKIPKSIEKIMRLSNEADATTPTPQDNGKDKNSQQVRPGPIVLVESTPSAPVAKEPYEWPEDVF